MKKRICPKCKSKDIRMRIPDAWTARIGANPGWKCEDCGLELPEFPEVEEKGRINIEKLKKKNIKETAKIYSKGLNMQIPKSYLPLEEIEKNLKRMKVFIYKDKEKVKGLLSFNSKGKNNLEIDFICSLTLRKGIGKKLIKKLAEFSIKNKIRTIYSNVSSKDKRVMKFYEKCGFEHYGKPYISNKLKLYKIKSTPEKILKELSK